MRPLRLDLQGFAVFKDKTTVDFQDADFFALVGPTGAGKSTVLDAICFALYGTVPRWGDRRRIDNALAPSAAEARVRLVFTAGGDRFVATRIIRRDSKGRVGTAQAGLEQLPRGFDLAELDLPVAQRAEAAGNAPDSALTSSASASNGASAGGLGTVLAGTPAEMEAAVAATVGLPYEQFISSILLPQGEFARFLHAKPAERQEILVNLLGLHVYQRIAERASATQREAEAKAAATRGLLAEANGVDDAALAAATERVSATEQLAAEVERSLPALTAAVSAGESAGAELQRVETDLTELATIKSPADVASVTAAIDAATLAVERANAEALAGDEREEKLRSELAGAGDRSALLRLLDSYTEQARLRQRVEKLALAEREARVRLEQVSTKATAATESLGQAQELLSTAKASVETAQTADRAATLRQHLIAGAPCPVCEQQVAKVPKTPAPALAAARAALAKTEQAMQAAQTAHTAHQRQVQEADRACAASAAAHAESALRLAELETELAAAPALTAIRAELAELDVIEQALADAGATARDARQAVRDAVAHARSAQERVAAAWRQFDAGRDRIARLAPPPAQRESLVDAWAQLTAWGAAKRGELDVARSTALTSAQTALAELDELTTRLGQAFAEAGQTGPGQTGSDRTGPDRSGPDRSGSARTGPDRTGRGQTEPRPDGRPSAYREAAAMALHRARAELELLERRRAELARVAEQAAAHEREAQIAKALAQHLRADRFERWLLTEALDALVEGASTILRGLTGGHYELTHDKGEFYVVDHGDAGLRRAVRTLSGGETFQASLALALALSEQLAGLSNSASLESILLDEGFGTLDAATLDTVAATLENLASIGERMVGVVTHVPALAERIPVRFEVSRDARGGARVQRFG